MCAVQECDARKVEGSKQVGKKNGTQPGAAFINQNKTIFLLPGLIQYLLFQK
jgi:hypothetical protein